MTSEMVERVAKAIRAVVATHDDWDSIGYGAREMYRRDARAAIEAMRTPTPDMCSAGEGYNYPDNTWEAMIDAALAKQPA